MLFLELLAGFNEKFDWNPLSKIVFTPLLQSLKICELLLILDFDLNNILHGGIITEAGVRAKAVRAIQNIFLWPFGRFLKLLNLS